MLMFSWPRRGDDRIDRQVELRKLLLVDVDLDLVLETAADLDRGDAVDRFQLLLQIVVGVATQFGQLLHRVARRWPTARCA